MAEENTMTIHPRLSKCNKCFKNQCIIDVETSQHPKFEHCKILKCKKCKLFWYACIKCNKRFSHSNTSRMNNHFVNEHSPPNNDDTFEYINLEETDENPHALYPNEYNDNRNISETNDETLILSPSSDRSCESILSNDNHNQIIDENIKRQKTSEDEANSRFLNQFFEPNSRMFLKNERENPGNGICGLVATAFSQSYFNESKTTLHEAIFHLNATHFCTQLTESQQSQFSSILYDIVTKHFSSTKIPTSISDIRKHYTTGKFAIYQNLPTPKVINMDNHACVSIKSILDHALGMGIEINLFRSSYFKHMAVDNSDLYHIQRSRNIFEECYLQNKQVCDPYVILLILWSDDFEVNHTRKNRNSTWLKTLTIIPPRNMSTSRKHTHAICLGRKNQDHSFVNNFFQKEIETLCEPKERYIHQLKQHVPTVARVLVMSCDRPERCSSNNVLNYTGSSTRRWLYSSLVSPYKIASCKQCLKKTMNVIFQNKQRSLRENTCPFCCDFEYDNLKMVNSFPLPDNYPTTVHQNSPIPPKGRDIEFAQLNKFLQPAKLSYENLVKGLDFAMFNLHTQIWTKQQTVVYLKLLGVCSRTIRNSMEYVLNKKQEYENIDDLMHDFTYPPMWKSCIQIEEFIETPMHHLFEGVVKAVIELQMEFFKQHNKWSHYGSIANPILGDVNQLKCSYNRCEAFTSGKEYKTGGWLAETYLGYSRLIVILFGHVETIVDESVLGYNEMIMIVQSLHSLISCLMQHCTIQDIDTLNNYVKLFLASCHYYEASVGFGTQTAPFWYRKSNFVSLLNLPHQVKEYGPVYLHWEGVRERFIQHVKPALANMRTSVSYLVKKLNQIHQDNTLQLMYDNHVNNLNQSHARYDDVVIYDNLNEVDVCITNHSPLSGVSLNGREYVFCVIVKVDVTFDLFKVIFDDSTGFHKCNQWYAPISIEKTNFLSFVSLKELLEKISDYIMLIPFTTSKPNDDDKEFTIVSKNWMCRKYDNSLSTFEPSRNTLKIIIDN